MKYYECETINGAAFTDIMGIGVTSTEGQQKTLLAVILTCSAKQANKFRLWMDREKTMEIDTQQIPLRTYTHIMRLEVGVQIPVGHSIIPSLYCGGSLVSVDILYEWE